MKYETPKYQITPQLNQIFSAFLLIICFSLSLSSQEITLKGQIIDFIWKLNYQVANAKNWGLRGNLNIKF